MENIRVIIHIRLYLHKKTVEHNKTSVTDYIKGTKEKGGYGDRVMP